MSLEPTAAALIGQTLGKRYLVRRLIGSGGMGAVYEVEHLLTKRIGALKLLHPRYASVPEVVARFVMEASAAGRIDNPHVVQTFDAGELESGEPYMFMELLAGEPVSVVIQRRGRLRFDEARELVLQAASGLAAAHAAHIVHRDVKPENLFLCRGERPFVKVLDFGISKFARAEGDPRLTAEGAPLGTPYYMSPEQVVGERDLDQRTDVYSLGVVLYECVTGEVPFKAESLPALGVRITEGHCVAPSERVPELPRGLDQVIARAMSLDAADRFADMPAFAAALSALSTGPAVSFAPTLVADSTSTASRNGPPSTPRQPGESSPTSTSFETSARSLGAPASFGTSARSLGTPATSPSAENRARRRWALPLALLASGAVLSLAVFALARSGAPTTSVLADAPSSDASGRAPQRAAAPALTSSAEALSTMKAASVNSSSSAGGAPAFAGASVASARPKRPAVDKPAARASRAEKDGLSVENPF